MKWIVKKIKVSDLKENPHNPRKLTEKGLNDLEKSITKFGIAEPLVCNTDLMICGGHGRKKILERLNIKEVDCYIPEKKLTEKQFNELGIRLNKNIAGEFDFDILANEFEVDELIEWGFDEKELDLNLWNNTDDSKLDEVPEIPKTALSRLGDIFEIDGKHRVMCGDSTKAEDVEKLMDGKKADMVFTDPPYNVDYSGRGKNTKTKIKNDCISMKDFETFLFLTFIALFNNTKEGAVAYIWHADSKNGIRSTFEQQFANSGWHLSATLIWAKKQASMGWQDYRSQHEPCLYGFKTKGQHKFYGDRSHTTLWVQGRDTDYKHPTQKPIELSAKAINNSSKSEDIILDLFLGSGSTLIACQQTNRICYGMEIDPIYIDVILKRYKKLYPEAKFKCLNRKFDFDKLFTE